MVRNDCPFFHVLNTINSEQGVAPNPIPAAQSGLLVVCLFFWFTHDRSRYGIGALRRYAKNGSEPISPS